MYKAIKIRLYPNKDKQEYISRLLGSNRFVYNNCLELKKEKYLNEKNSLGLKELTHYFHNNLTKNDKYEWLREHNTKVLKVSIMHILDAYKGFYINGKGFPKFKSKNDNKQSCMFPYEAISTKNDYLSNHLTLTKQLKNIRFRTSNKYKIILNESKIRSATLTKTRSNKYFLSILVDTDYNKKLPTPINNVIGIDLGIKDFIVDSNDNKFKNIKSVRNNEKQLSKLHRELSRKEKGSKNKDKARIKLAKKYERINNKKEYYLHEISNKLLNENQVIVMEDLNVSGMMKNENLAKSIQELSLYQFKQLLTYKCDWYGRDLIQVDRWFPSSKLCSCCGYKNNDLTLKDREWFCPSCGSKLDRDLNAAINIKNEGLKIYKEKIPI